MALFWKTFLLALFLVVLAPSVSAATVEMMKDVPQWNDFDLGPTSFAIDIHPGETLTKTLQVTNRLGRTADFMVSVEDFEGSHDISQSVVLQGKGSGRYSAKDWVVPEMDRFTLDHGQMEKFTVTITAPQDADVGDHYASVLVQTTPPGDPKPGSGNVKLISRVGSLFFLRVPGETKEAGQLDSFTTDRHWYWQSPVQLQTIFENTGNARLTPSGTIRLANLFGQTVDTLPIDSFNVLRDSVRSHTETWKRWPLLGRYTATLSLDRGYGDTEDTQRVTFWVIPVREITEFLLSVVLFLGVVWLIRKKFSFRIEMKKN